MKNSLLILALLTSFSCRKKEDTPTPEPKSGRLEIEYKTLDTEMTLYHKINNESSVAVKNIIGNYYKLDTIIPSGQAYAASIAPVNCGCKSTIVVKFEGDTIDFHEQTGTSGFVLSGTCPVIE